MSLLLLFLSASAALPYALGQSQCDGTPIPEAAGMAAYYPPGGQKAEILDGDDEARSLFETSSSFTSSNLVAASSPCANSHGR